MAAAGVAWLVGLILARASCPRRFWSLPPGVTTMAQRIFGLLHATAGDEVAGLGLVQAAVVAPIALIVSSSGHSRIRATTEFLR